MRGREKAELKIQKTELKDEDDRGENMEKICDEKQGIIIKANDC